jgi:hypothetical protein
VRRPAFGIDNAWYQNTIEENMLTLALSLPSDLIELLGLDARENIQRLSLARITPTPIQRTPTSAMMPCPPAGNVAEFRRPLSGQL